MRLIFMGTPDFSSIILEALLSSAHEVVAVYSQPPRPAGRGHRLQKSPVHEKALEADIPVFTPVQLKGQAEQEAFAELEADIAVVAAYGLILPNEILQAPHYGCINVHTSLLPRWRGAAPIQRSLLAGDKETGVTIIQMDAGLDTGDIFLQEKLPIFSETTALSLDKDLAFLGAKLSLRTLDALEVGKAEKVTQPKDGVTYAEKLRKEEGLLDWGQDADFLDRQIRALNPWPGTYFLRDGERYRVKKAQLVKGDELKGDSSLQPGTVLDDHLTIQCGQGKLRLEEVQKPGRSSMKTRDFLNGTPIKVGSVIGESS